MKEEKEIKVQLNYQGSIPNLKKELEQIYGIDFQSCETQEDIYYDYADYTFFNLNHALRIRKSSKSEFTLAYKALFNIPFRTENPWFVLEYEKNLPISKNECLELLKIMCISSSDLALPELIDLNSLKDILQQLNLKMMMKIEKSRYSAEGSNFKMELDLVKELGIFLEIENNSSAQLLGEILKKLPYQKEIIKRGYTTLFAQKILKHPIPDFDNKGKNNPYWNFLPGQKEIVINIIKEEKKF